MSFPSLKDQQPPLILIARGFKLKGLQWPETWKGGTVNVNFIFTTGTLGDNFDTRVSQLGHKL